MQPEFQTDDKLTVAGKSRSEAGRRARRSDALSASNGAVAGGRRLPELDSTRLEPLETGILRAVSYADVFDFPLTAAEIHHNLVGMSATEAEVQTLLERTRLVPRYLERHDNYYYTLPARGKTIAERRRRAAASVELWPWARYYGQMIARLPFVRMVAVTGALAVNNARPRDDIDYLIVTEPGRLWLSRAFVILMVKRAARQGIIICPNYFLTERTLALPEQDLFTAHELLQMVPITGLGLYRKLLALNPWAAGYLPNAWARSTKDKSEDCRSAISRSAICRITPIADKPVKRLLERLLRTPPGDWLERWEMTRKIARFSQLYSQPAPRLRAQSHRQFAEGASSQKARQIADLGQDLVEVSFNADRCKGHFHSHGRRTLDAYTAQVAQWATEEQLDP